MPYLTYLELTVSTAAPNAVKEVKPIIQQKARSIWSWINPMPACSFFGSIAGKAF